MPLAHLLDTKVQGTLQLISNDVVLFDDLPPLQAAIGKIEFTERGVSLNGVGASFMGGPLALTGGTQRDGAILIKLAGTASADGLRKTWPAPAMQRLAGHFSGATRFTGAVAVKDHKLEVTVDSTLAGLGLAFPAPASKAAALGSHAAAFRAQRHAGHRGRAGARRDPPHARHGHRGALPAPEAGRARRGAWCAAASASTCRRPSPTAA